MTRMNIELTKDEADYIMLLTALDFVCQEKLKEIFDGDDNFYRLRHQVRDKLFQAIERDRYERSPGSLRYLPECFAGNFPGQRKA